MASFERKRAKEEAAARKKDGKGDDSKSFLFSRFSSDIIIKTVGSANEKDSRNSPAPSTIPAPLLVALQWMTRAMVELGLVFWINEYLFQFHPLSISEAINRYKVFHRGCRKCSSRGWNGLMRVYRWRLLGECSDVWLSGIIFEF